MAILHDKEDFSDGSDWDHLQPEDVARAVVQYCETHDDMVSHSYQLLMRAEQYDRKYQATFGRETLLGRIGGIFQRVAYGYERAALRAQAHHNLSHEKDQKRGGNVLGLYHPDHFRTDPALIQDARLHSFQRINVANGHGYMYER